jgi:Ca-activated chloride channel family protein
MRFVYPAAALWLLALPVMWFLCLRYRRQRERARLLSGIGSGSARVSRIAGLKHDLLVAGLATVAGAALVGVATRPQAVIPTPQYESRDLLLLLDRSASMLAQDVQPSRARRASQEIRNFLRTKPDAIARVGLIGFAGSALALSQQTSDTDVLLFYLNWVDEDPRPMFGTNLRSALENALEMIGDDGRQRPTFVVVLSDGDDQGDRLQETVARFATRRLPIYTIGIGSTGPVSIPSVETGGVLLDDQGQPLTTEFDEATLRTIADRTGGRYFRSTSGAELQAALDAIARSERRIVGWTRSQHRDVYPWILAGGAMALAALVAVL